MAEKTGAGGKPQEFDEESGRYGSDSVGKSYRKNTSYAEIIADERGNTIQLPKKASGFEDKKRKHSPDHVRHAEEMGFKNHDEYENAAIDFWNKGEGGIFYGNKRKRFAKYNERTGEYLVIDSDGTLRTYYKINLKKFKSIQKKEGLTEWKK